MNAKAYAEWKENCQRSYDPMDPAPALPLALRQLESSKRPDALDLEQNLRALIEKESRETIPVWNSTRAQDLTRSIQEFLFQQKPDPGLEPLRSHWLLLMLAQRQWDVLNPALKKTDGPLNVWLQAETSLGLRDYAEALRAYNQLDIPALRSWLDWRRMETLFLLGQNEGSLDQLALVLKSELLQDPRLRERLQSFIQAFSVSGRAVRPFLQQLKNKADADSLGQAAFCVLTVSRDADDRGAALAALLQLPEPHSQSLRLAGKQIEKLLVEPVHAEGLLNWLESYTNHAAARFRRPSDLRLNDDAYEFMEVQRKAGDFLLTSRTLVESSSLLDRLDGIVQKSLAALPKAEPPAQNFDVSKLVALRGRILEKGRRNAEAARLYRELALSVQAPSEQRRLANLMLQNFGLAAADLVDDPAFTDACRIYQKLVPEARQELARCDLMMARQALSQGQETNAQQKLWQIVYAFPHKIEGQTAAERLIELNRKTPDDLYRTTDTLLNISSFQSGPWALKLKDLRRQSSYQRITQLASSDDQAEAYFVFSQKEKGDPLANESLLTAVAMDQKSGRLARALDRLEIWLHDYPDSRDAPSRLLQLISMAENALQIPRVRQYLQWTRAYTWTSEQKDQIQEKTCLFDILEQPLTAIKSCEALAPHVTQGSLLRLRLARALAYGGYSDPLHGYAQDHLLNRQDLSVDQKIMVLDLLRRARSLTPARDDDIKTTMTNYYLEQSDSLGPESRRILGGLAYDDAQKSLTAFQAIPVYGTRSDELIASIQAKKQAFDEIEALYNKVLQTKDPHWGSSALCDLALAAENFAEALNRIPEIEGLDRKKLLSQIASQIAGWRAKAKSMAGQASKTVEKFGILHPDNQRVIQEAHRLKDDPIQFNDWLPSLIDAEAPGTRISSWTRWDEVATALLESSQANRGVASSSLILKAIYFTLQTRDFARTEWLNERLIQSTDPRIKALGLWQEGRLKARLDLFGQAEDFWQKALALDPEQTEIRKQLGLLHARFGFFAKAMVLLKPIEDDPQLAWTMVAIERQLERNESADQRCEVLTAVPAPAAEAYYNCGLLEFQNHRNAGKAISWMESALRKAEATPPLAEAARQQLTVMQNWKARFQPER
ncbi:MAG TPA: hypothetical protein VFO10_06355 [Oligoflexus sp.]|uniref:tetratricopeptide repeat protein n=1 Tax=Oligoflexus sp. TaxID=1971216 RepID=UPI002D80F88F|nr:hypothetical protein [Oligoflexus sp.]HET9236852.1 hypothetical protein [Oligoflexus sp.]